MSDLIDLDNISDCSLSPISEMLSEFWMDDLVIESTLPENDCDKLPLEFKQTLNDNVLETIFNSADNFDEFDEEMDTSQKQKPAKQKKSGPDDFFVDFARTFVMSDDQNNKGDIESIIGDHYITMGMMSFLLLWISHHDHKSLPWNKLHLLNIVKVSCLYEKYEESYWRTPKDIDNYYKQNIRSDFGHFDELFGADHIVIPFLLKGSMKHYYLAVVVNPGYQDNGNRPRIILMDSMNQSNPVMAKPIQDFLLYEWKKSNTAHYPPLNVVIAKTTPQIDNSSCGLFVLEYFRQLFRPEGEWLSRHANRQNEVDFTDVAKPDSVKNHRELFGKIVLNCRKQAEERDPEITKEHNYSEMEEDEVQIVEPSSKSITSSAPQLQIENTIVPTTVFPLETKTKNLNLIDKPKANQPVPVTESCSKSSKTEISTIPKKVVPAESITNVTNSMASVTITTRPTQANANFVLVAPAKINDPVPEWTPLEIENWKYERDLRIYRKKSKSLEQCAPRCSIVQEYVPEKISQRIPISDQEKKKFELSTRVDELKFEIYKLKIEERINEHMLEELQKQPRKKSRPKRSAESRNRRNRIARQKKRQRQKDNPVKFNKNNSKKHNTQAMKHFTIANGIRHKRNCEGSVANKPLPEHQKAFEEKMRVLNASIDSEQRKGEASTRSAMVYEHLAEASRRSGHTARIAPYDYPIIPKEAVTQRAMKTIAKTPFYPKNSQYIDELFP